MTPPRTAPAGATHELPAITRRIAAMALLGTVLYGLYLASTAVVALVPAVRISVSVGRGILAPRLISFICGL